VKAFPVRNRWIAVVVVLALAVGIWWVRRRPQHYSSAYVSDRAATLWSTTAQVREPVATLRYGDRVAVLRRSGDQAQVRAANGTTGWMDGHLLMDPLLWQQGADLITRVRTMSVQAVAHTRAVSNVHIEPKRDAARIFQFGRNVPVAVFERKLVTAPASEPVAASQDGAQPGAATPPARDEDWLLVLRTGESSDAATGTDAGPTTPIAGWVLSQFIALDPPAPIPDYTNAAGVSVVAWAVLNTASDPAGGKPQYLVATARGGEARVCDFNGLRVYTWGSARQRYETAYVENDLCGKMPLRVRRTSDGAEFSFATIGDSTRGRTYRMRQTRVRRVRGEDAVAEKR